MSETPKGPPVGYVDILNTLTAEKVAEEGKSKKYNPLRPSSSGKCTRELAYGLAEFHGLGTYGSEELRAEQTRIFDLGHHIETHAIRQFQRYAPVIELKYQQQVLGFYQLDAKNHPEMSHYVEGSLDACYWTPGSRGVIDYKSKKDKFSSWRASNWDEMNEKLSKMHSVHVVSETFFWVPDLKEFLHELADPFFESNFLQLNGYACTQFLRERGVDHGSIIQYNKNDSRMREVRFAPSMELFDKVRAKFQSALEAVDAGNPDLAPRDHVLGSVKCAYCPYKARCWGDVVDAKKEFFKTLPAKDWPKDSARLPSGEEMERLFAEYEAMGELDKARRQLEERILLAMTEAGVKKIRLESGDVYESRSLKDGLALRRSKA